MHSVLLGGDYDEVVRGLCYAARTLCPARVVACFSGGGERPTKRNLGVFSAGPSLSGGDGGAASKSAGGGRRAPVAPGCRAAVDSSDDDDDDDDNGSNDSGSSNDNRHRRPNFHYGLPAAVPDSEGSGDDQPARRQSAQRPRRVVRAEGREAAAAQRKSLGADAMSLARGGALQLFVNAAVPGGKLLGSGDAAALAQLMYQSPVAHRVVKQQVFLWAVDEVQCLLILFIYIFHLFFLPLLLLIYLYYFLRSLLHPFSIARPTRRALPPRASPLRRRCCSCALGRRRSPDAAPTLGPSTAAWHRPC